MTLEPLTPQDIEDLLLRAIADEEHGLGSSGIQLAAESLRALVESCEGDARRALGLLEAAAAIHLRGPTRGEPLAPECVREAAGRRLLLYDRDREEHYNVVSALIKSLRASDPDAALYYLARMLGAGEDPLFIARRLLVFASEDVGNADPSALGLALASFQAVERLGMPEARITLAQATTYLACALKSNASYAALGRAQEAVEARGSLAVPLHLRNAPTALMRELGYGRDYRYPHDEPDHFSPEPNLPDALADSEFYRPTEAGAEAILAERLRAWRARRAKHRGSGDQ